MGQRYIAGARVEIHPPPPRLLDRLAVALGVSVGDVAQRIGVSLDAGNVECATIIFTRARRIKELESQPARCASEAICAMLGLPREAEMVAVQAAILDLRKRRVEADLVAQRLGLPCDAPMSHIVGAVEVLSEVCDGAMAEKDRRDAETLVADAVRVGKIPARQAEFFLRRARADLEGTRLVLKGMSAGRFRNE